MRLLLVWVPLPILQPWRTTLPQHHLQYMHPLNPPGSPPIYLQPSSTPTCTLDEKSEGDPKVTLAEMALFGPNKEV